MIKKDYLVLTPIFKVNIKNNILFVEQQVTKNTLL